MIARAAVLALALLPSAAFAWTKPPADDACRAAQFENAGFTLCKAIPGKQTLRLVDRGTDGNPVRSLAKLKATGSKAPVAFAMNAGMFNARGLPVGLLVIDGQEERPLSRRDGAGNFFMKPNGIFYEDANGWHVAETDSFVATKPDGLRFATQSGPMLLVDGALNPHFTPDGPSRKLRNGVCVDAKGVAWFAISDAPVSFGRFARLFRDRIGCRDALYLDGSVSSLWDPAADRLDERAPLGPIMVAEQSR
jgi:uncharacterized protein YigE (DUF2233 family)